MLSRDSPRSLCKDPDPRHGSTCHCNTARLGGARVCPVAERAIPMLLHCVENLESTTLYQWHSSGLSLRLYIFSLFLQRYQYVYLMYWLFTSLCHQPALSVSRGVSSCTWPLETVRAGEEQGLLGVEEGVEPGVEHPRTWASRASFGLSPRRISLYKPLSLGQRELWSPCLCK